MDCEKLSLEVGLCHQTVCHILKKCLNTRKMPSHWVPQHLTKVQKRHQYAFAGIHLDRYRNEGDAFPKIREETSHVKVMLIMAYDWEGVILTHAVFAVQSINTDYYCRFLQHHLRPAMQYKRPRSLQNNFLIVLHDNVVTSQIMPLSFCDGSSGKSWNNLSTHLT